MSMNLYVHGADGTSELILPTKWKSKLEDKRINVRCLEMYRRLIHFDVHGTVALLVKILQVNKLVDTICYEIKRIYQIHV